RADARGCRPGRAHSHLRASRESQPRRRRRDLPLRDCARATRARAVRATSSSPRSVAARGPVGAVTRGTTAPRRLRRVDRWLVATHPRLVATPNLLVVDLGFGARPFTTLELAARLRRINPGAHVVGLEIDPERVAAAAPYTRAGMEF